MSSANSANGHKGLPPGPRGQRLRNVRQRVRHYREFMKQLNDDYGDIVYYELPKSLGNCCALFDAELIRDVYVAREPVFPPFQDPASYGIMKNAGIFRSTGQEHRALKKVADSAFSMERLPMYAELVAEDVRMMKKSMTPEVIDIETELGRLVRSLLIRSIVGRDVDVNPDLLRDALKALKWDWALSYLPINTNLLRRLPLPQNFKSRRVIDQLDDIIYAKIRAASNRSTSADKAVISLFVHASEDQELKQQGLLDTADKIRDETYSMLLGNMDGPVAAMVYGAYHIAKHETVRKRIEAEVDGVLGDRDITGDDYFKLPYIHAVFQEVMRHSPPGYTGNAMLRVAATDCVIGGYLIPEGTIVQACAGMPHMAEQYWDNPHDFEPERWSTTEDQPSSGSKCPAHAYIPFGLQPHACPAWEWSRVIFTLAFASIAQHFRLDLVSDQPPKIQLLGVGVQGPYRMETTIRPDTSPQANLAVG